MGWWSNEIFGGDSPLDAEARIRTSLGLKFDYDNLPVDREGIRYEVRYRGFTREILLNNIDTLFAAAGKDPVHLQVLGALCVKNGVNLSKKHIKLVMDGIKRDDWLVEDGEHRPELKELQEFLKSPIPVQGCRFKGEDEHIESILIDRPKILAIRNGTTPEFTFTEMGDVKVMSVTYTGKSLGLTADWEDVAETNHNGNPTIFWASDLIKDVEAGAVEDANLIALVNRFPPSVMNGKHKMIVVLTPNSMLSEKGATP